MNDQQKPNAEQFAKVVLWNLSHITASLTEIQSSLIRIEMQGADDVEILEATAQLSMKIRKVTESFYLDALQRANVKP